MNPRDFHVPSTTIATAETSFSEIFSYDMIGANNLEATLDVTAITGAVTTFDVIPQYSYDKVKWFDQTTANRFTQATVGGGITSESIDVHFVGLFTRFKYITTGAAVNVVFTIDAIAKN